MNHIGLIFDMDGVIVDNNEYHFKSWQKLAEQNDISITREFYREKMNGRTLMALMRLLFGDDMSETEAQILGNQKESIYRELYADHRQLTNGLQDFLNDAFDKNIPMVVGTSAPVENVVFTLDGLGIRHFFKGVVDASMVKNGKPNPEVYLKCAEMIERAPENCIVFEDAVSGIEAGKNAGAKVIGLATSHEREELDADLIINDFSELTWQQIEELIGK